MVFFIIRRIYIIPIRVRKIKKQFHSLGTKEREVALKKEELDKKYFKKENKLNSFYMRPTTIKSSIIFIILALVYLIVNTSKKVKFLSRINFLSMKS